MKTASVLLGSLAIAGTAFAQSPKTSATAAASTSVPVYAPVKDIHAHVCGIHFYAGDMSRQIIAEHFCSHLSDEVLQCIIYDSDKPGARLIGVEYIVSAKIFAGLSPEEKKLWHSHNYEVKSGVLTAPGVADTGEKELMKVLINTYGKTWHTWQVDRDNKLPLGIPQLMMAFTKDGQAKQEIVAQRDQLHGPSQVKKNARADIADVNVDAGADAWQKSDPVQLELKTLVSAAAKP